MTKTILLLCALTVGAAVALQAANYQEGTVVSMDSVPCGTQAKSHHRSQEMLCKQYVIRSSEGKYVIQHQKQNAVNLLPVGHEIEFRIDKNDMIIRGFTVNGKKIKDQKYLVISYNGHEQSPDAEQ